MNTSFAVAWKDRDNQDQSVALRSFISGTDPIQTCMPQGYGMGIFIPEMCSWVRRGKFF